MASQRRSRALSTDQGTVGRSDDNPEVLIGPEDFHPIGLANENQPSTVGEGGAFPLHPLLGTR